MTDDHTDTPHQPRAEPGLRQRLEAVLPPWTHWSASLLRSGFTATWTTTDGTWSLSTQGFVPWPRLEGPGGTWAFGNRDADHVIGVLRALGAIDAGSQPDRLAAELATMRRPQERPCFDCGETEADHVDGRCGAYRPAGETA